MTNFSNLPRHYVINVCKQALEDHSPTYACNSHPCSSQWWDTVRKAEVIVDKLMGNDPLRDYSNQEISEDRRMVNDCAARLLDQEPRRLGAENIAPYNFNGDGFVKLGEGDDPWIVEICYTLGLSCVFCGEDILWGAGYGVDADGGVRLYYN